jgi:hypothetical protein
VAAIFFAVAPRVGLPSSVRTTPESSSDASVEKQVSDSLLLPPSLSLLDEELRELDADLARVNTLLDRFPSDRHLRPFTEVFEERAHQIREHRKRIVSSITKESYQ